MNEAVTYQMPQALRNLFITILTMCNPSQPLELYNQFKAHLMEDFVHNLKNNSEIFPEEELLQRASTMLLIELDKSLDQHGKTTTDFNLPPLDYHIHSYKLFTSDTDNSFNHTMLFLDDMCPSEYYETNKYKCNTNQKKVLDALETKLDNND